MDVVGLLSNHEFVTQLHRVEARDWKTAGRRHRQKGGVAPDGRRPFGELAAAVLLVLSAHDREMSTADTHRGVQDVLGEPISYAAIKAHLRGNGRTKQPVVIKASRRGLYRVRK